MHYTVLFKGTKQNAENTRKHKQQSKPWMYRGTGSFRGTREPI
uniref:Uncharacterized protein n=1 Tax=Anopheles minimus TaxID=112268 RepID=A0A182WQ11_9DIPT